ncbi:hypothetical protein JCM11491_004437 [Sporobolomyces phaffii]
MQSTTPRLAGLVPRTRPLPARKQVLFAHHRHLLASNDLVLFLRPGDFSAHEWRSLRASLANAESDSPVKLTLLRPGLLPALLRDAPPDQLDRTHLADKSHLAGPLAALSSKTLSPRVLERVLKLVNHFSKTPAPNSAPLPPTAKPVERLAVLSSVLERRVAATAARTAQVANLPELDVLRSQLVGLVGMPASRIVGVVSARASDVARTLQGFHEGLKEPTTSSEANP